MKKTKLIETYVKSNIWGKSKDYEEDKWSQQDIELHKSINWESRNYEEYPVPEDSFMGRVFFYGDDTQPNKIVKMIKYLRANPIYPPYYAPEKAPFEGVIGPMYDGRTHQSKTGVRYDVHDRYETQDVYDRLSR